MEVNASGQLASTPLPTPEKFSFGGPDYGRGFSNSHIFGDAGWSTSVQLMKMLTPKMVEPLPRLFGLTMVQLMI